LHDKEAALAAQRELAQERKYVESSKLEEELTAQCHNLQRQEVDALKVLDTSKAAFQQAVDSVEELRQKLVESQQRYEENIKAAQEQGQGELEELQKVLDQKAREVADLELEFNSNEIELKRKLLKLEEAETQLEDVRSKYTNEKQRIQNQLRKEYDEKLGAEAEKADALNQDLAKLRSDFGLAIEFARRDLYILDAGNEALEKELTAQTNQVLEQSKATLSAELQQKEDDLLYQLDEQERKYAQERATTIETYRKEEDQFVKEAQKQLELDVRGHIAKMDALNRDCEAITKQNLEKADRIEELTRQPCQMCPKLDRKLKKTQRKLIDLQFVERDLRVSDANRLALVHIFQGPKRFDESLEPTDL
jgi:hypothetical protein